MNVDSGLPYTADSSDLWTKGFRDYSGFELKPNHRDRPVWVCPDGYLILEMFTNISKQALDLISTIAEPLCRPDLLHEYQITVFSLYAAISVGLFADDIIRNLDKFSKNVFPKSLENLIISTVKSFGQVKLVLRDNKYYIESKNISELNYLLSNEKIKSSRIMSDLWSSEPFNKGKQGDSKLFEAMEDTDNTNLFEGYMKAEMVPATTNQSFSFTEKTSEQAAASVYSFELQQDRVEEVKREALENMHLPLVIEYDFRKDRKNPSLNCIVKSNTKIRYYQERALCHMFSNGRARSGIIVLPCGAGKTLTGIIAACTISKSVLVLTTSAVAVEQWIKQFLSYTNIPSNRLIPLTSDCKTDIWPTDSSGVLVSTYTMMTYSRKHSELTERIMRQIRERDWGLLIFDEVQFAPAPAFRRINDNIRSHCKLGLTATLVREDDLIKDLQWIIGPKLYEANWLELQQQGYLAKVLCQEVWCPMTPAFYKEYLKSSHAKQRKLWSCNPIKLAVCEYLIRYHEARGDKLIIFSDVVFALLHMARSCSRPFIYGKVSATERIAILTKFKNSNDFNTIFLSKVGDNALDIPCANVVIQISFNFASRRQEAQRLGRILRPKPKADARGFNAFFYSLVSKDTQEMVYSDKRQQFIINQGYSYNVISCNEFPFEGMDLYYNNPTVRQDLLLHVLSTADDNEEEEEDENIITGDPVAVVRQRSDGLAGLTGGAPVKQEPPPKQAKVNSMHPLFRRFIQGKL